MPVRNITLWLALLMLAACGGGGSDGAGNTPPPPPSVVTRKVGGNVFGLRGSGLVLQMGSGETLAIQADGSFTFPTSLADGSRYDVKVSAHPDRPLQTCDVSNGSGTLGFGDITNVNVRCETTNFSVGGSVTGLAGQGLFLNVQGTTSDGSPWVVGENLPLSANGNFAFPTHLMDGSTYTVIIGTQPTQPQQTCRLAGASGTVSGGAVTSLSVTCTTETFSVSGIVSGLHGTGLVLQNNGGDDITITQDGPFAFPTRLNTVMPMDVKVAVQPSGLQQTCFVANGSATEIGGDFDFVRITCTATKQLGTAGDDEARAVRYLAPHLYVAGRTTGVFAGSANAGGWDGFLVKFHSNGELRWKRQFGSSGDENVTVMQTSSSAIYVAGSTTGALDGAAQGSDDIFVTKFDLDGNQLWTRQVGTVASDVAESLTIGSDGLYIAGHTDGDLSGPSAGGTDVFVAKLDFNGTPLWVRQFGTPAFDAAYGIDVDVTGTSYIVGATAGDLGGFVNTSGGEAGFVVKYDTLGNPVRTWLMCMTSCFGSLPVSIRYQTSFNGIVTGLSGDLYIAGSMREDSLGTFRPKGWLLVKYDAAFLSFLSYQSETEFESAATYITDGFADGAIYVAGYRREDALGGKPRGFFFRRSAALPFQQQYFNTIGSSQIDNNVENSNEVFGVATDFPGNSWVVGRTSGSLDGHPNLGGTDFFIVHYNEGGVKQ